MELAEYKSHAGTLSVSRVQLGLSLAAALAVHIALWQILSTASPQRVTENLPDYVTVKLIEDAPKDETIAEPVKPEIVTPAEPIEAAEPLALPPELPAQNDDTDSDSEMEPNDEEIRRDNGPRLIIDDPKTNGPAIDERFRLKGWSGLNNAQAQKDFKALSSAVDCFGFETKCAAQRKSLFAEYQATDEQRALEQRAPHIGLPSEFYGLSEREIRKKLNVPFAGENGQVIIPFLLTINGPIWDALHGVNKSCEHKFAGVSGKGHTFVKDCGSYRRADPNAFKRFEQQRDGERVPFQNLPDKEEDK